MPEERLVFGSGIGATYALLPRGILRGRSARLLLWSSLLGVFGRTCESFMIIGVPCSSTSTMMFGTEGAYPKERSTHSFFGCADAVSATPTANPARETIKTFDNG